ncbi:MAG TPA: hypothetical protein VGL40_05400 [Bacillota bacterium]
MTGPLVGLTLGLVVGAFNWWLLRGATPAVTDKAGGTGQSPPGRAPAMRGLGWRMVLRNVSNLAALLLVYTLFRDQWAILAALFGLLVFPTVTVIQLYYGGGARR